MQKRNNRQINLNNSFLSRFLIFLKSKALQNKQPTLKTNKNEIRP